jgi:hypothetical protein
MISLATMNCQLGVEHDLSDVLAILHALMRGRGLFQRIDRIHHRQHLALTEKRPDMVTQFARRSPP